MKLKIDSEKGNLFVNVPDINLGCNCFYGWFAFELLDTYLFALIAYHVVNVWAYLPSNL